MICFFRDKNPNELYAGMLINSTNYNIENASSWSIEINEGQIYLFPASLAHAVIASTNDVNETGVSNITSDDPVKDLAEFRVAIAGDIVLTHKEKAIISMGLQPVKNWRTF